MASYSGRFSSGERNLGTAATEDWESLKAALNAVTKNYNATNLYRNRGLYMYVFRRHLYILHNSPDDGLSGPKHVASGIIKLFIYVTVTSSFLFGIATIRIQQYKNIHYSLFQYLPRS
jgi:hypothetical protein